MNILIRTGYPCNLVLTSGVDYSITHVTYSAVEWFSLFISVLFNDCVTGLKSSAK